MIVCGTGVGLFVLLVSLIIAFSHGSEKTDAASQFSDAYSHALPPDGYGAADAAVTQANIADTICKAGYSAEVRPSVSYTNKLKSSQLAAMGYQDQTPADYEEDHIVSLELGGSPADPKNLYPEPYVAYDQYGVDWGARQKDRVEDYLHSEVCGGYMTLQEAQDAIKDNWMQVRLYMDRSPQ